MANLQEEQLMYQQYVWLLHTNEWLCQAHRWLTLNPMNGQEWKTAFNSYTTCYEKYNETLRIVMDYYKAKDDRKYRTLETIAKVVLGTIVPVFGLYAIQRSPNFIPNLKDVSPWIGR